MFEVGDKVMTSSGEGVITGIFGDGKVVWVQLTCNFECVFEALNVDLIM